MDLQLSNKTALVTDASQGIGRATAKSLAAEGVQIAIAARRGELLNEVACGNSPVGTLDVSRLLRSLDTDWFVRSLFHVRSILRWRPLLLHMKY